MEHLRPLIERARASHRPTVELLQRSTVGSRRLGVFASSFNPVTRAHLELMRRAATSLALDETLALAGLANADKSAYEASIEDRLRMLELALAQAPQTSIGLASHAFFVDMLEALAPLYGEATDIHFILGFDTFERLLDRDEKYTKLYHRRFENRLEALAQLLKQSRLLVAGRAGANREDWRAHLAHLPQELRERVAYLDFPAPFAEQSASEARARLRRGLAIDHLLAAPVEQFIRERGLYRDGSRE